MIPIGCATLAAKGGGAVPIILVSFSGLGRFFQLGGNAI